MMADLKKEMGKCGNLLIRIYLSKTDRSCIETT